MHRSFSELYQKSIQDAESMSGEGHSGEAWVLDERDEEEEDEDAEEAREEEREQGEGEESDSVSQSDMREKEEGGTPSMSSLLSPPSLPLLRATSLQDNPPSHTMEITPSSLTRSYSLERTMPYQDICDGYICIHTHTNTHTNILMTAYPFKYCSFHLNNVIISTNN